MRVLFFFGIFIFTTPSFGYKVAVPSIENQTKNSTVILVGQIKSVECLKKRKPDKWNNIYCHKIKYFVKPLSILKDKENLVEKMSIFNFTTVPRSPMNKMPKDNYRSLVGARKLFYFKSVQTSLVPLHKAYFLKDLHSLNETLHSLFPSNKVVDFIKESMMVKYDGKITKCFRISYQSIKSLSNYQNCRETESELYSSQCSREDGSVVYFFETEKKCQLSRAQQKM